MNDTERLILIRALATNCRENVKNGADEDNRPLLDLIHEYAFGINLGLQEAKDLLWEDVKQS